MKHYVFLRRSYPNSGYGGLDRQVFNWFKQINYNKYRVTFVVTKDRKDLYCERMVRNNIPVTVLEYPFEFKKQNSLRRFFDLLFFLKRIKPSAVVFLQSEFNSFHFSYVFAAYLSTLGNIYMTEHLGAPEPPKKRSRYYFGFIPGLGIWRYRQILSCRMRGHLSKKIFAVSDEVKNRIVNLYSYPAHKIYSAYHGVDINEFAPDTNMRNVLRKQFDIPSDDTVILSTSRLEKSKRLDLLIGAFEGILEKRKNCWLLFLGLGRVRDELEKLAGQKQSKDRIKFLGWQENGVSSFLKMSDIFVLPSENEGLSIATLEAMASGVISIATRTPGPSEIIEDGITGFLVGHSEDEIRKGLIKALTLSKPKKEKMVLNARTNIEENFDIAKNVKKELEILDLYGRNN